VTVNSCTEPAVKELGLVRFASAPTLATLMVQRPFRRQFLPPLDVTKSPGSGRLAPLSLSSPPGASSPTLAVPTPDESLRHSKRQPRRTKTHSVSTPEKVTTEPSDSPARKPRRCKTSAADCLLNLAASAETTPLSTPDGSCRSPALPSWGSSIYAGRVSTPLRRVEGQEGTAWIRGTRLGSGSYGTVFKAMEKTSGRMFAVKEAVLGEKDGKNRERLESELQICRSLRHEHIVSYLGHIFTDEHLNIYLEYVPGGSMASVLSEFGALGDRSLRKATAGMLEGLNYLHTQDPPVVHRDIKAANLLVDLELHVKLADFGCSKCSFDTQSFTTVGSVPWMAPEVMLLDGGHGRKADIWSVGCTILELATAENPWGKNAFDNIMYAMQHIAMSNNVPPIPDAMHAEGRAMVEWCVNRIAPQRPQARELLEHPFVASRTPPVPTQPCEFELATVGLSPRT